MTAQRLPESYFRRIYEANPDPWGFEDRWYERRKYALTLGALPRNRYRRTFEPGCSFGVLTERLAERTDALVAYELVADVAERARQRVRRSPHVAIEVRGVPDAWPAGAFDLVVLSEVLYYLTEDGVAEVAERIRGSLEPGGDVVAVHYRGETDYPLSGDGAHAALIRALPGWTPVGSWLEPSFRIDVLQREPKRGGE